MSRKSRVLMVAKVAGINGREGSIYENVTRTKCREGPRYKNIARIKCRERFSIRDVRDI